MQFCYEIIEFIERFNSIICVNKMIIVELRFNSIVLAIFFLPINIILLYFTVLRLYYIV